MPPVPAPTRRPTTEEEGRIHPYLADRMGRQGRAVLINDDPVETVQLSERDIRQIRATYFGLIAQADAGIGRILLVDHSRGALLFQDLRKADRPHPNPVSGETSPGRFT